MNKNIIIAAITVIASISLGGDLGIVMALLGGLIVNGLTLKDLKAEKANHIDTAANLAEVELAKESANARAFKAEAMLDRVQKETLEMKDAIKSQAIKISEFQATMDIGTALPEAEVPVKKTRKTTVKKTK